MSLRLAEAAYGVYIDYLGLKLHFAGELDYTTGVIESRLSPENLAKRRDWRTFVQIVEDRKESRIETRTALVTLLQDNPKAWVGDMLTEDFTAKHYARIQRLRRLDELFVSDLVKVSNAASESQMSFLDFVMTGDPPNIIRLVTKEGGIAPESLALIHYATGLCDVRTSHPLWERKRVAAGRYALLLSHYVDLEEVRALICDNICAP